MRQLKTIQITTRAWIKVPGWTHGTYLANGRPSLEQSHKKILATLHTKKANAARNTGRPPLLPTQIITTRRKKRHQPMRQPPPPPCRPPERQLVLPEEAFFSVSSFPARCDFTLSKASCINPLNPFRSSEEVPALPVPYPRSSAPFVLALLPALLDFPEDFPEDFAEDFADGFPSSLSSSSRNSCSNVRCRSDSFLFMYICIYI